MGKEGMEPTLLRIACGRSPKVPAGPLDHMPISRTRGRGRHAESVTSAPRSPCDHPC